MPDERRKSFYLTTPGYFVNARPHIGHAYTTIAADAIARYHRLRGHDVRFVVGTDENSQKNADAAKKSGYSNVAAYLDMMAETWRSTWARLGISFDHSFRTTSEQHRKGVEKLWKAVLDTGDVYLGDYEGAYCVGCEEFYTASNLVDGKCPLHKTEPQHIKEKNYFFRLSAYRERLLAHIDAHPDFIQPLKRRNEARNFIERHMADISITRQSTDFGMPVPGGEDGQVLYVWFEAPFVYVTNVGYGTDDVMLERYWPASLMLIGKDILKFHCGLLPAMFMAAGLPLPETVFAHGFLTIEGDKMSKTVGNIVDPLELADEFGSDALRLFLLRENRFGEDGEFSHARMRHRYEGDLANELGNLAQRVLAMAGKFCDALAPKAGEGDLTAVWTACEKGMEAYDFIAVFDAIWAVLRDSNKLIVQEKPWELVKTDQAKTKEVIGTLLERLRHVAWLLKPLLPMTADELLSRLGVAETERTKTWEQAKIWGGVPVGAAITVGAPLFPRFMEKRAESSDTDNVRKKAQEPA